MKREPLFNIPSVIVTLLAVLVFIHGVRTVLLSASKLYVRFAANEPVKWQLLNQRTIPGLEPSAAGYSPAVAVIERIR